MSEPKWTPGPWRVAEDENNIACAPWSDAIGIEAPEDPECGSVPSIVAWTTRGGWSECDARLIAAAPELYEVADEAPVLSKYHGSHGFEIERFIADYKRWSAKRRTILAKARGEVP